MERGDCYVNNIGKFLRVEVFEVVRLKNFIGYIRELSILRIKRRF